MGETQQLHWSTVGQIPTVRVRPRATLTGFVRCSTAVAPGNPLYPLSVYLFYPTFEPVLYLNA